MEKNKDRKHVQLADFLLSGISTPAMTPVKIARGKRFEQVPIHYSSPVEANHSQYSSPVETINLTVESKSLPIEVNNIRPLSHIVLCPSRRKKSLQP